MSGWLGSVVDACCVIAVVAGTVGPIGFLATQMSFGLSELFGLSDGLGTQMAILVLLAAIYVTSAVTGIHRGIQILSRLNVFLALAVAAPLMAIFVARISRGRSIREMIMAVAVMAPIATTIWFTLLGGSGHDEPNTFVRAFWGLAMAGMAAVLLYMGAGQISVLQQFIVITAIPVSLVLLPSLWLGPKAAYAMAREQNLIPQLSGATSAKGSVTLEEHSKVKS